MGEWCHFSARQTPRSVSIGRARDGRSPRPNLKLDSAGRLPDERADMRLLPFLCCEVEGAGQREFDTARRIRTLHGSCPDPGDHVCFSVGAHIELGIQVPDAILCAISDKPTVVPDIV